MLRRSKDDTINGIQILDLPPKTITVVKCDFSKHERRFYNSLEVKMVDEMAKIQRTHDNRAYMHVLTMLLRLRQGVYSGPCACSGVLTGTIQYAITLRWSMETGRWMRTQ